MDKKNILIKGELYNLRPVRLCDAAIIVDLRRQNNNSLKYINPTPADIDLQKKWIDAYLEKVDDYYFCIENVYTKNVEGLIALYDINSGSAEWGRWVVSKASVCAPESFMLMCKFAFDTLKLTRLYCHTIKENSGVVKFHDKFSKRTGNDGKLKLAGITYDYVEHEITESIYKKILNDLLKMASRLKSRFLTEFNDLLEFHHVGLACNDIDIELCTYEMLGYKSEGVRFTDERQGIEGLFISKHDSPRIELLMNLPGSKTLNHWLTSRIKMYHMGYYVNDIEVVRMQLCKTGARVISPAKMSTYFESLIEFLVLPNKQVIELIERKK